MDSREEVAVIREEAAGEEDLGVAWASADSRGLIILEVPLECRTCRDLTEEADLEGLEILAEGIPVVGDSGGAEEAEYPAELCAAELRAADHVG